MSKQITITIDTGNAAFQDDPFEVSRILRSLAGDADNGKITEVGTDRPIRDINGNPVGRVTVGETDEGETDPVDADHLYALNDVITAYANDRGLLVGLSERETDNRLNEATHAAYAGLRGRS